MCTTPQLAPESGMAKWNFIFQVRHEHCEEGGKGWGGGEGSRSRFTETDKLVLSQITGSKMGISRFTKKINGNFLTQTCVAYDICKVTPRA